MPVITIKKDDLLNLIGREIPDEEIQEVLFMLKTETEFNDNEISCELNPDRPDMLSVEGIARAMKGFLEIETGVVKYELVRYDHYNGDDVWDSITLVKGLKVKNNNDVRGVVLFQLIEDQKLKVEIFPNETAETVSGFTEDSMIYVR